MPHGNFDAVDRRSLLHAAGATGVAVGLGGIATATPGRDPGPKDAEILIGTRTDVDLETARGTVDDATPGDAAVVHENETLGYAAVELPDKSARATDAVIERLERQPGIAYAERNVTLHAMSQPNDPRFDDQTLPQQIRAERAWERTTGSMDVRIAIVTQGVDYTHPDLADRFSGSNGYDFVDDDADPAPVADRERHGTHVAGIAAATTGNGAGIAGLSNCHLLSARALDADGDGSLSDIADAVQWAADENADIVNISLGADDESELLRHAIDYASNNGTLPIAAAGNDAGSVSYPAAYGNCVAVSAVDADGEFADFSNSGPEIDVAAPGVDVLSTVPGGGYETLSGTSMACAAVTGIAALAKSVYPADSVQDLRNRLAVAAVDIGLSEDEQGAGRVDAADLFPDPPIIPPDAAIDASPSSPTVGEVIRFDGSESTDPDGSIERFEWHLGDGTTVVGEPVVEHVYGSPDEYSVELIVEDDAGKTDSATETVTVEPDDGGDCGDVPEYRPGKLYSPGDRVAYEGAIWEATWYVWGREPSGRSSYWQTVSEC